MIHDTIDKLSTYTAINPHFATVTQSLSTHDLAQLSLGHYDIVKGQVSVNIFQTAPKAYNQAQMEAHRQMIDIHVPISGDEIQGYRPASVLTSQSYDPQTDSSLHPDTPTTYYTVRVGEMSIHFPGEGHSPAITTQGIKKAVFKVKA